MNDSELLDIGAQAERTALSWQRTGIGVMANGALLTRWGLVEHHMVWPAVLLTTLAGVAVLWLVPFRYRAVVRGLRHSRSPLSKLAVPATAGVVAAAIMWFGAAILVSAF